MWRGEGAVAVKHPKEELGVVADKESVRYEVFRGGSKEEGVGGGSEEEALAGETKGKGSGGGGSQDEKLGNEGASNDNNNPERIETEQNKPELKCRVYVGERIVVEVGAGVSAIEVETRAAEEAVGILKREKKIIN